jgi:hypothetical protein
MAIGQITALEPTEPSGSQSSRGVVASMPLPSVATLSDLLGPDGHRHCTGWRLQPVEGSMGLAREHRAAWVRRRETAGPEPDVRAVRTFLGGTIVFAFGPGLR